MPSYTRGRLRNQMTYVSINATLRYGFRTKDLSQITGVSEADLTALGHTAIGAVGAGAVLCFGANSPKPPRATKRLTRSVSDVQGSVSTFCAFNRVSNAIAAGWSVRSGRSVGLRSTGRTTTAVVDLGAGQAMYAFPMNTADFNTYGADLGLQSGASISGAELNRLVTGSSQPRPGRATRILANGVTFTSFYSPDQKEDLQQNGWRIASDAILLSPPAGGGGGN